MIAQYTFHLPSGQLTNMRTLEMDGAVMTQTRYANLSGEHVSITVREGQDAKREMLAEGVTHPSFYTKKSLIKVGLEP